MILQWIDYRFWKFIEGSTRIFLAEWWFKKIFSRVHKNLVVNVQNHAILYRKKKAHNNRYNQKVWQVRTVKEQSCCKPRNLKLNTLQPIETRKCPKNNPHQFIGKKLNQRIIKIKKRQRSGRGKQDKVERKLNYQYP